MPYREQSTATFDNFGYPIHSATYCTVRKITPERKMSIELTGAQQIKQRTKFENLPMQQMLCRKSQTLVLHFRILIRRKKVLFLPSKKTFRLFFFLLN